MKKLLLLSALASVASTGVMAQHAMPSAKAERSVSLTASKTSGTSIVKTAKTTASGTRKYDHEAYTASLATSAFNAIRVPIWKDSTIGQAFTSGLGVVNYSSVGQSFYLFDDIWNDETNPSFNGQIKVTGADAFNVDSVSIMGMYIGGVKSGASDVDTLEISLGVQPAGYVYYWLRSTSAWAAPYLASSGKDTLYVPSPINVDSANRRTGSMPAATAPNLHWKVPLDKAMLVSRDVTDFTTFAFKVPSTFTVPAGNQLLVTYTFRTGAASWSPSDTIDEYNHFAAGYAFPGAPGASDVQPYKWYDGDHSMSLLMFSTDTSFYAPTLVIGATNDPTKFFAQYLLNTVTVSCASCGLVGDDTGTAINEVSALNNIKAFPNPSNDKINVSFTSKQSATVSVSISNMMGQVIATENMGAIAAGLNKVATFNTASLSSGVYFYTVEANGQRMTSRFTVTH